MSTVLDGFEALDVVETIRESLIVLDGRLNVRFANSAFYRTFAVVESGTVGSRLYALGNGQWDIPALRVLLEDIIPNRTTVEDYEVRHVFPDIGDRTMLLNARVMRGDGIKPECILLAIEDVTGRRRIEAKQEAALTHSDTLLTELSHRMMNSLSVISSIIHLESRRMVEVESKEAFGRLSARLHAVAELYKSLLKSGDSGRGTVETRSYLTAICRDVLDTLETRQSPIRLDVVIDELSLPSDAAISVGLVLNEILTNAVKYAFPGISGGTITVRGIYADSEMRLSISDNGRGINPAAQKSDSGVGAQLVKALASQLGGRIQSESGRSGTTVSLIFPAE